MNPSLCFYTQADLTFPAESDRIHDPSKIRPEDIRAIGSIRVTLYRATAVRKDVPIYFQGKRGFIPDELPEELLKGLDVKNNVKYVRKRMDVRPI